MVLHARVREVGAKLVNAGVTTSIYDAKENVLRWDPAKTAIIICDMWDQHWCRGATRRVGELAPGDEPRSPSHGPRAC